MIISEEDYIAHYGILRRSGRYPWGSGGNVATRSRDFLGIIQDLRDQGLTDAEIMKGFAVYTPDGEPITSTDFRHLNTIAKNQKKMADISWAERLKAKGMSNKAIAEKMGLAGESSVRALLAPGEKDKAMVYTNIANTLKDAVREKKYVQVGTGVELHMGISRKRLDTALAMLQQSDGYVVETVPVRQLGTGKDTNVKVLAPPGSTWGDIAKHKLDIRMVTEWFVDHGRTKLGLHPPLSIDSSRLAIKYKEDGGDKLDGVIYVREGVRDISLDKSRYAQVRILIDGTHFIKGMAIYSKDLPDGVDLLFHTAKSNTGNKLDALKPVKKDPANPNNPDPDNLFGSSLKRQIIDILEDGTEKLRSAMNIVNEEGGWQDWSRSLSSQFLSKQSPVLARNQLAMKLEEKQQEFDEIMGLTNPTVKRRLLETFADGVDSSAVALNAASLTPDSQHHVILPITSMSDHEVYAPNYTNGTRVVLIRHPQATPLPQGDGC